MDGLYIGIGVGAVIGMVVLGIIILCKRGADDSTGDVIGLEETLDRRRPIQPFISEESSAALDEAIEDSRKYRESFND